MDMTERETAELLRAKGWGITPPEQFLIDMEPDFMDIWKVAKACTMTSVERGYALYKAVEYIIEMNIPGDFVECGVWKGGSCMIMALALLKFGGADRCLFLYDTYEGMTEPGHNDYIASSGKSVLERWKSDQQGLTDNFSGWNISLEAVRKNVLSTGYPEDKIEFVKGPVEHTLKNAVHEHISLLRLDTDWYESTRTELEKLYPFLSMDGVLIIDDYGHFTGARKAVDEYFGTNRKKVLMNRIDYTGRIAVKTEQTK